MARRESVTHALIAMTYLLLGIGKARRLRDACFSRAGGSPPCARECRRPNSPAYWLAGTCLTFAPLPSASQPIVSPAEISVRDSIQMTRLVEPSPFIRSWKDNSIKFSPDGSHFAIVTQTGNLDRDTISFEILTFNVDQVRDFANSTEPSDARLGRRAVSMQSTPVSPSNTSPAGIASLRWLSDSTLAFLGQQGNSPTQVYSVDISTRHITQLTKHDRNVKRFAVSADAGTLVYAAEDDGLDLSTRNLRGYAVESGQLHDTLLREPSITWSNDEAYFALSRSTGTLTPLTSPGHSLFGAVGIWLSPRGRWAVTLANATDVPSGWLSQYAALGRVGEANKKYEGNPALDPRRNNVRQYVLIDTASGHTRPLLPAPVAWGRYSVHWAANGESIIVSNTLLPLEGAGTAELQRRRNSVSVVEIDIESGQFSTIDSYASKPDLAGSLKRVRRLSDDILVVDHGFPGRDETVSKVYRRLHDGEWVLHDEPAASETNTAVSIFVAQDVNTPPDVAVTDNTTGRTKRITNLNPSLRNRIVDSVKHFEWTDKNGRVWEGGLLYPPDYRPDQRYPLVIQTYGYSPDEFLIDGPLGITSAFAARPLASQGMVVLQMSLMPSSDAFRFSTPDEGPNYVAAFEGAIRALEDLGTIDPQRVGLIGWSRTGLHVSYAVAFSDVRFAAATIADSVSNGLTSYMSWFGSEPPGVFSIENGIGVPFWAEGRHVWLERSPNFNAHRIHTPIRFEAYGVELNSYWDMYTLLRRHHRPAEMFHIPIAAHNLKRPQARYASQQGNVDWFAFWLTDYEDPDPSKVDQYRRWRELRRQHTVLEIANTAVNR